MMKVEELMKPRVRCKGNEKFHFPNSPFEAGEILEVVQDGARLISPKTGNSIDWLKYKRFPHLFEEVFWYEDRNPEDMPEYLKDIGDGEIYKAECTLTGMCYVRPNNKKEGDLRYTSITHFLPSNETEYTQFNQSKK